MEKIEILIIGTAGQGVKTLGKILAKAAAKNNYVYSYPSYTPDARSGDIISSIVISDSPKNFPLVEKANYVFVMSSNQSLLLLKDRISENAIIVSLDPVLPDKIECQAFLSVKNIDDEIPLNIFMLAIIQETIPPAFTDADVKEAIEDTLGKKKRIK